MSVPPEEYRERQRAAWSRAAKAGLAAVVCASGPFYERPGDVAYLTGHLPPFPTAEGGGRLRGVGHAAAVLSAGRCVLVVDTPHYRQDVVVASEVVVAADVWAEVGRLLKPVSGPVGCVGSDVLPWEGARTLQQAGVELVPADAVVRALRQVKSAGEVELLRQACQVAGQVLASCTGAVVAGVTEGEVAAAGAAAGLRAGADFVRYVRVHSGPWSAWPTRWPPATDRRLEKGDLVLLDAVGARAGYAFDVGRTTLVGFDALPWQREMFDATARALAAALRAVRPGVPAGTVAREALRVYEERGLG
ncbi:MAG: M24 family metallopeptidase, partial [Armatimonadota bacterium]|nr:M24 family metallopeptidase [Armatimonadota bacterium]MDW8157209.1 M24 family metallopeptidase [Armatimonadota bacterium]